MHRSLQVVSSLRVAALAFAVCLSSTLAHAFPERAIRVIVPYAAGGYTDATTRIITNKLASLIGKPVVVENRGGANGVPGTLAVAQSTPDGHTVGVVSISHTVLSDLVADLPFDPVKDFTPVAMAASTPQVLVTGAKSRFATVADVVSYAKANPGKATIGTAGGGTLSHLVAEQFKRDLGIDLIVVPYRGGNPALTDVIGGQIDLFFDTMTTTAPNAKGGTLRALAITSPQRHTLLPDVPTMAEAGHPGFTAKSWSGFVVPAGTPKEVIDTLNKFLNEAISSPDVKQSLLGLGTDGEGGSTERFGKFLDEEKARWSRLIKEANIKN